MSVPNQTPYIIYNANGLTTVFPFEFYIINSGDIQVSLNGGVITTGYSVSGVGNVGGGDVTFLTPPANGTVVMLERVVPTYRLTDYQDNGDLLADTVNKDFDRLWMAIQRSFIYLGLALRRPLLGGPYNAEGYRISNLADPVNDQDAVTKGFLESYVGGGGDGYLRSDISRTGAVGRGIQEAINQSRPGQAVLTLKEDEFVSSLSNEYGVEIDPRRGRVFDTSGVQLSTYSDPRSRFVNGEQYLHYVLNKMTLADGFTPEKKTYILWSGDSTVVGVNSEAWPPAAIANQLARAYGIIDVQNVALGHSGKTLYEWGFFYIDSEWSQHDAADLLILRWGINDPYFGYTLEQVKEALERGLSKLRANKGVAQQSIIIMAPNATADTPNGRDEKWYEQLTALLRAKAKEYQCMFFDTYGFYQDARRGAGVWLDDPYSDGRGIHPDFTFSSQIISELMRHVYGPCAAVNGKTNVLANTGSSVQTIGGGYPPSSFPLGISMWRTDPTDSSWPISGAITVERTVDLISVQRLTGYSNNNQRITLTRFASGGGNWSQWRGLQNNLGALLTNGWTVGASRSATYQKSVEGMVTLSAILVAGTVTAGTIIATLPAEFRPKNDISYVLCGTNTVTASVNILANGTITVQSVPSDAVLSLAISFPSFVN